MHGPYTAEIVIDGEALLLTEAELAETSAAAQRFYDWATPALVDGATRCATFAAAALLDAGKSATIVVRGYAGSGSREKEIECREVHARRDDAGRFLSTLGSRFNERHFVGV